jgi:hypothetical protein
MSLTIKPKDACRWDLVSLGEVMLRFDPGEYRIWTTRNFRVSDGGGEYNVARGLKRCFGLDTAIVTAFAKNPVGLLGNEEDFSAALGYDVPGTDENLSSLDPEGFRQMIQQVLKDFPFKVVTTTLRKATTATRNDWGAIWLLREWIFSSKEPGEPRNSRSCWWR